MLPKAPPEMRLLILHKSRYECTARSCPNSPSPVARIMPQCRRLHWLGGAGFPLLPASVVTIFRGIQRLRSAELVKSREEVEGPLAPLLAYFAGIRIGNVGIELFSAFEGDVGSENNSIPIGRQWKLKLFDHGIYLLSALERSLGLYPSARRQVDQPPMESLFSSMAAIQDCQLRGSPW
jgi:hypothetical protein